MPIITTMTQRLARLVSLAMQIREQSYDKEAAAVATANAEAAQAADTTNMHFVDYNSFYRKSLRQAADDAAGAYSEPAMGDIVYYLMLTSWNDVAAWAKANS